MKINCVPMSKLIGKTIAAESSDGSFWVIRFTDGTVCGLAASADEDGDEAWINSVDSFTCRPSNSLSRAAVRAGVITKEQFDALAEQAEEKRVKERRKEYERLKREFEPEATK